MKKYLAEGIGTYGLVFMGTGAIIVNQITGGQLGVVGIGLVFGLVVLAMIYALGPVSGAHLNPAVTIGFATAGRHPQGQILPYILSQLTGALLASVSLRLIFAGQPTMLGMTMPSGSAWQSVSLEFILTAMLMFVILQVATGDREEGLMAGVAIGGMIALEAIFGGPISGASMNPARSFGPALIRGNFRLHWIYWVGPMLGSIVGAWLSKSL